MILVIHIWISVWIICTYSIYSTNFIYPSNEVQCSYVCTMFLPVHIQGRWAQCGERWQFSRSPTSSRPAFGTENYTMMNDWSFTDKHIFTMYWSEFSDVSVSDEDKLTLDQISEPPERLFISTLLALLRLRISDPFLLNIYLLPTWRKVLTLPAPRVRQNRILIVSLEGEKGQLH